MSRGAANSGVDRAESGPIRVLSSGPVGKSVRLALADLELAGSGRLIAPMVERMADAVDAAARAGDLALMLELSVRFEKLVDRLNLDPGSVVAARELTAQERAAAAAQGGPR